MVFLEEKKTPNPYPDETSSVTQRKSEGESQIKSVCCSILCHHSKIATHFPGVQKYSGLI